MALVPSTQYPAQTDTDAAYPQGKARNAGSFQDGTGTPLEKNWINDLWGFLQALLDDAGITPSGSPDEVGASDYLDAVLSIASRVPRREFVTFDDFGSDHISFSAGNDAWDQRWTSSAATTLTYSATLFTGDPDVIGLATITNGTAGALAAKFRKADGMFVMARFRRICCRMRINSIIAGMGFRVGAVFSGGAPIFTAVFEPATSANWLLRTNGGFDVDTGVAVAANTFYEFDLVGDGAAAYSLSVNGSTPVVPADPAHIPAPTSLGTLEFVLTTPAAGASRAHQMDYVYSLLETPGRVL